MKKKIKDTITRYIIPAVILTLMLLSPIGDRLQSIFDKTILPYLDYPSNIYLTILAILFLLLAFWHNCKRLKEKILMSNNWLFALGCTNLIILLFWIKGSYSYAPLCNHIPFFTYINCFVLINFTYIAVSLFNWIRSERAKFVRKSSVALNPGKPINKDEINEDYEYTEYIDSISPIIIDNFDEQVSVSVGISGAWGSGKTTFLHALQAKINANDWVKNNDRIVIEFKPWFCEKKTDLVQEFFKVYREHMGKRISGFDSDILEYAKVLTENVDKLKWMNQIMKLCTPVESIQKQFDAITDKLKRYKIPVYIIIDDLDRLDGEEIMEILRLIRITANFPYTQFILAYDKPYIQKAIKKQLDYDESERFIHKIINSEIALPYFDYSAIGREIFRELSGYSDHSDVMKDYLTQWRYYKSQKIIDAIIMYERVLSKLLPTFRDVYRFVNMFKLDYEYFRLKSDKVNDYVDYKDYFTLSVIKYSFFDFYTIMKDDSHKLFQIGYNINLIKEPIYSKEVDDQSKSIDNWLKKKYEEEIKFFNSAISKYGDASVEYLIPLLEALFDENSHNENSHHCIRRRRAYNQYFQFKTIDYIIYKDELASFISGRDVDGLLNKINKLIIDENVQITKSEFSSILSDLFISYVKEDNYSMLESMIEFTDIALLHPNVKQSEIVYAYADYFNAENSFNAELWLNAIKILLTEKHDLDSRSWGILLPEIMTAKDRSIKDDYKTRLKDKLQKSSNGELIIALYASILANSIKRDSFLFDPEEINEIQISILDNLLKSTKPFIAKIKPYPWIRKYSILDNGLIDNNTKPVDYVDNLVRTYLLEHEQEVRDNFIDVLPSEFKFKAQIMPLREVQSLVKGEIDGILSREPDKSSLLYVNSKKLWDWLKKHNQDTYLYDDLTQTKTVDQWIAEGMPGLE